MALIICVRMPICNINIIIYNYNIISNDNVDFLSIKDYLQ